MRAVPDPAEFLAWMRAALGADVVTDEIASRFLAAHAHVALPPDVEPPDFPLSSHVIDPFLSF